MKAEDELVVLACPDPPGADDAIRVVRQVAQMDEEAGGLSRPIVIFNQRLSRCGWGEQARMFSCQGKCEVAIDRQCAKH